MSKSQVVCVNCCSVFLKSNGEINRTVRRKAKHFCGLSCAAHYRAIHTRAPQIVLHCPCGRMFRTTTKAKAAKHCSRACASRFSMNDERREAQRQAGLEHAENLLAESEVLKLREGWKYAALETALAGRNYEFEYELGGYVFDLALLDVRILVEFDGPYHENDDQIEVDEAKDEAAEALGFVVVRRPVQPAVVISPATIRGL